jgi:hypothetical protein
MHRLLLLVRGLFGVDDPPVVSGKMNERRLDGLVVRKGKDKFRVFYPEYKMPASPY